MANPIVTPEMFDLLRSALGLGVFQKHPTCNNVILRGGMNSDPPPLVDQMLDMELLKRVPLHGPAGVEWHIRVSDEGVRLAVDDMARYHAMADQVKEDFAKEHFAKLGSKRKPYIADGHRIHAEVIRRMAEIEAE